jgi:hypothetical protein
MDDLLNNCQHGYYILAPAFAEQTLLRKGFIRIRGSLNRYADIEVNVLVSMNGYREYYMTSPVTWDKESFYISVIELSYALFTYESGGDSMLLEFEKDQWNNLKKLISKNIWNCQILYNPDTSGRDGGYPVMYNFLNLFKLRLDEIISKIDMEERMRFASNGFNVSIADAGIVNGDYEEKAYLYMKIR